MENGRRGLAEVRAELEEVEIRPPIYGRWVVAVALGLTAASLARLFGGDWPTFAIAWLAGSVGMWLRQEMGRRGFNLFFIPFAAALVSGAIGGVAVLLGVSATPALCLVAPGMIIVPGVASHTTRTLCMHLGVDVVSGTLVGALAAGFLAHWFARHFRAL